MLYQVPGLPQHKGVVYDAYKGRLNTIDAKAWSVRYLLGSTGSFSVKMYGDLAAQSLVECWAERMSAFYRIYASQKAKNYEYTQADIDSVTNCEEFESVRTLAKGQSRARYDAIATVSPHWGK